MTTKSLANLDHPARGGSKSIPRKNIRSFAGYPLIAYSIAAGLAAETVTRVIVSTDDEEIAAIARQYGAETPFLRPAEFSQDETPDLPVFQHALEWLAEARRLQPGDCRPASPHLSSPARLAHRPGGACACWSSPEQMRCARYACRFKTRSKCGASDRMG